MEDLVSPVVILNKGGEMIGGRESHFPLEFLAGPLGHEALFDTELNSVTLYRC
jgi:hypothetical protein